MFADTKGVIRCHKSKNDRRQHNGQKKRNKETNKGSQNATQKTKDWATQIRILTVFKGPDILYSTMKSREEMRYRVEKFIT